MLSKVGLKVGAELHSEDTATSGHIALRTGMAFKRCSPGILSRRFATSIAPRDLGDSEAAHSEPECLPSTLSRTSRNNSQDHIEETNLTDGRRVAHPKRKGFSVTMATPTSVDTTEWSRRYSASMVSQRVSMCSNSGTGSGIPCDTGHNENQHAKTAPPSPELLHAPKEEELARHSESTSLLEMSTGSLTSSAGKRTSSSTALDNGGGVKPSPPSRRGSTSPTGSTCPSPASTPGLASEHKGLDTHGSSSKLPSPASSPPDTASHYNQKSTKTRHTLKFQRLFRNIEQVPQDEQVVKQFSCAYFGDILLQGYLYITPNFFCFYARILGHEKQIVIPINTVVNLTRERTAFIIPNAIGIVTNEDKFVFGSLMSRDNTFRTMWNVWKAVMSKGEGHHLLDNRVNLLVGPDTLDNNNSLKSKEEGSLGYSDSSVSEASICPECSNPMTEHDPDGKCCPLSPGDADGEMDEEAEDPSTSPSSIEATKLLHAPQRRCFSGLHKGPSLKSLHRSLRSVVRLPKNNYLLALCSMLVTFLCVMAVVMAYKVVLLEGHLQYSSKEAVWPQHYNSDQMFSDVYYLNSQHHSSTVQRFHSIIEANIQLLSQVHESLRILHESLNSFAECKRPASTIP